MLHAIRTRLPAAAPAPSPGSGAAVQPAREPARYLAHQGLERLLSAGRVYAVARGHLTVKPWGRPSPYPDVHAHNRLAETRPAVARVDYDAREKVVHRQIASLGQIMRDGMTLADPTTRSARIGAAHEVFLLMEQIFADAPPPPSAARSAKER
nr:hypothetical protein [Streptomyces sp. AC495_CC817]